MTLQNPHSDATTHALSGDSVRSRSDKSESEGTTLMEGFQPLPVLRVTMLGSFTLQEVNSITQEPLSEPFIASPTGRSKRLWMLIAYLIVNRGRGVSSDELIDLLWPEGTQGNPTSTLQNNMSRARKMLAQAGFSGSRDLLKYEDGLYWWAPNRQTVLDVDVFEQQAHLFDKGIPSDQIDEACKTCELYGGDFLNMVSGEPWCANINIYYRALFARLCKKTVNALYEQKRMNELATLCVRAIDIDPAEEIFSVMLMRGLTATGDARKAIEHYNYIKKLYEDYYNVSVSADLETERAEAMRVLGGKTVTEEDIRKFLEISSEEEDGAFFCSNAVFREIVRLQIRAIHRSKCPAQLVLLTLHRSPKNETLHAVNMKRIELGLTATLRSGDPFTKLGTNQFLLLLPGATRENGEKVVARILRWVNCEYPRASLVVEAKTYELSSFFHLIDTEEGHSAYQE